MIYFVGIALVLLAILAFGYVMWNQKEAFTPVDRGNYISHTFVGRAYPTARPCHIPAFPGTKAQRQAAKQGKQWQFAQDGYMGPTYVSNNVN